MAKAGTKFELLVQAIYQEILISEEFETVTVEHDIDVIGKTGQEHQIDVYWEIMIAGVRTRFAVECKDYKRSVSVGNIRDFYGVLEDIGNIQGIFVTTRGYQSGAKYYGEKKGISLMTVSEPTQQEMDEVAGIPDITLHVEALRIQNVAMQLVVDFDWIYENTQIKKGETINSSAKNNEILLVDADNNLICTAMDLEKKLPRHPLNTVGLSYEFDYDDTFIFLPESEYPPLKLNKLIFSYDTISDTHTSELRFTTMAKALLKDISTNELRFHKREVRLQT